MVQRASRVAVRRLTVKDVKGSRVKCVMGQSQLVLVIMSEVRSVCRMEEERSSWAKEGCLYTMPRAGANAIPLLVIGLSYSHLIPGDVFYW